MCRGVPIIYPLFCQPHGPTKVKSWPVHRLKMEISEQHCLGLGIDGVGITECSVDRQGKN